MMIDEICGRLSFPADSFTLMRRMMTDEDMKMRFLRKLPLLILFFCCALPASGQVHDTLRIVTYNILNYPGTTAPARNPEFRKTMAFLEPDILILQEVQSSSGLTQFLNSVMNTVFPGTYEAAPFVNGPDTDNGLIYNPSKVTFIAQTILSTALRDINGYQLRPVGVSADSVDIRIYSAHLKASQGYEDERFAEADILRNHLNALSPGYFIVGGDLNLYNDAEPAYQELIGSQADNSGRTYDPINSPGVWHDDGAFADIHTQSTRLANIGDGGSTGGMDDRFDFLLPTYNFQAAPGWEYIPGSYAAFGNDGNHFNQSINNGGNSAVPDSIADALHLASDHLPAVMEIRRQVVSDPFVTLVTPNGGEIWYTGYSRDITWTSANVPGTVSLDVNRSFPSANWETIVSATSDDGLYTWPVNEPLSEFARVRITVDGAPTVKDSSDANFFIQPPELNLIDPNGGETWYTGTQRLINWSSLGVDGDVTIELNRSFPTGGWEVLFANTANDGNEPWPVTGPVSSVCRIRLLSDMNPAVTGTSSQDFSIADPFLSLQVPDGGEIWPAGDTETIQWNSGGLTGDLIVELDRNYPVGPWETIAAADIAAQFTQWLVTEPVTDLARIRIYLVSDNNYSDSSAADFSIILPPGPPDIFHDARSDTVPGNVTFTARVTDDLPGFSTKLFYRLLPAPTFDSLSMAATGNPDEFAATPSLTFGVYEYFLRATDADLGTMTTGTRRIVISESCAPEIAYDDGSAELFNWSADSGFSWAVRFSPPAVPFVLCQASFAVAAYSPDSLHTSIEIAILQANGPGGMPGDTLFAGLRGSIGNLIGGFPAGGGYWALINLFDDGVEAPVVMGDFYAAVTNPAGNSRGSAEAFGLDNSSPPAGRSVFYDPCDAAWYPEDGIHPNSRPGNRMLRLSGWTSEPPELTIQRSGDNIQLSWNSTGATYYRIYRAADPGGPFESPIASVADTAYTDPGVVLGNDIFFYRIVSAASP